jgi:hypothetical protein
MNNNQSDVVIDVRATLAAVLATYGDAMPTRASVAVADAVDALTDPLTAPAFLPAHHPLVSAPHDAIHTMRGRLLAAVDGGGVEHALTCARAARALAAAETAWPDTHG